jgi:CheY-like chemotaxis protein
MNAPCSVLVVDDNASNVALLEHLLKFAGYEVRVAGDAEEALQSISERVPKLVVTDVQLPGMSGLDLARRLKSHADTAGIRILAVTAFAMPADQTRARDAGCDGYVAKPIDTRRFSEVVAALLEQS